MSLPQFIRDNTNDGHDIARLLIDVMNDRIDGSKLSHRLTAARLLTIYGHEDADDFIANNTHPPEEKWDRGDGSWVLTDPDLTKFIRFKTYDGRAMCLFLINVMEGKVEGIHVGHRVSAAKELLHRAFGKSRAKPMPKPATPKRQTHKTHQRVATAQTQAVATAPAASEDGSSAPVALSDPNEEARRLAYGGYIDDDVHPDPYLAIFDTKLYEFMNECDAPDFDPFHAALDEDYFKSYTGCENPECEVHGDPPEIVFDPNDYHY